MTLFAVDVDAAWIKAFFAGLALLIGGVSYAFVRMYKATNAGRNTNVVVDDTAAESRESRRARRDSVAWNRAKEMIREQSRREKMLEERIDELAKELALYRVEAAECKERERAHLEQERSRDARERDRDARIRELEARLGIGSAEHPALRSDG